MRGLGGASGFGETMIARGDDTVVQIDISAVFGTGIPFSPGVGANQVFLHTDGYLTFGAASPGLPADPTSLTTPFIAPFMADIDTRLDGEGAESGPVWLDIDSANDIVTFTWENVGFYRRNADLTNTFQLTLYLQTDGSVDIVFRYERIDWTAGDLQDGWGGTGGTPAFAGYRLSPSGSGVNLPWSRNEAGLLGLETGTGNTGQTGMWHYRFGGEVNQDGGAGNDILTGGAGADSLYGGAGNDTIAGLAGADALNGGTGFDLLDYGASDQAVNVDLRGNGAFGGHATGDVITGFEAVSGSAFHDTLTGSTSGDALEGMGGNDILSGLGGNDTLSGGAGNDTLTGGAGADQISGGAGQDRASYADAAAGVGLNLGNPGLSTDDAAGDTLTDIEEIQGSSHADTLIGGGANDTFLGEGGNDSLSGDLGNDSLDGGTGDDTLMGGAGDDRLEGGAGTDLVSYADASAGLVIDLGTPANNSGFAAGDTLTGIEAVEGSDHADTICGDTGANQLYGGAGGDQIFGGAGSDILWGGADDDILTGGAGADRLEGGAGTDWASYATSGAAVSVDLATGTGLGGDAAGDILIGIEIVEGSAFADTLTGSGSNEALYGGDGADRLDGGTGQNQIFGGAGDDILIGGAGPDTFDGGAGSDIVDYNSASAGFRLNLSQPSQTTGAPLGDQLISIEGAVGSNFDDVLTGDANDNRFWGRAGNDLMFGEAGHDRLDGGGGNDTVLGGAGNDSLYGDFGDDIILGDDSGDLKSDGSLFYFSQGLIQIAPGASPAAAVLGHDDFLFGGAGADRLFGGVGSDVLTGGDGNDRLHGGAGADRFVHAGTSAEGTDLILDYDPVEGDRLVFTGAGSGAGDFGITRPNLAGIGTHSRAEMQITYIPSGQVIWTLSDGAGLTSVMVETGNLTFDLLF